MGKPMYGRQSLFPKFLVITTLKSHGAIFMNERCELKNLGIFATFLRSFLGNVYFACFCRDLHHFKPYNIKITW